MTGISGGAIVLSPAGKQIMTLTAIDYPKALSLLSSMYLLTPTREAIEALKAALSVDMREPLVDLKEALDMINMSSDEELDDLLWEYTRLFIGPYRLPCPPWESVYTSSKKLMMQEAYDEVRQLYNEIGLTLNNPDIIADHIGAELNFIGLLLQKAKDDPTRENYYTDIKIRFLDRHIMKWVPQFARDMEEAAESALYKALARATLKLVSLLKQPLPGELS
jgi:TorA maturation chaperone TorD